MTEYELETDIDNESQEDFEDLQEAFEDSEEGDEEEGPDNSAAISSMLGQIAQLTQERDELKEQLMRSLADFQNFRKRSEADKQAIRTFANEKFAYDLLPVLDNFDRALQAITPESTGESIRAGIEGVQKQLTTVLASQKLIRIPAVGLPFDPERHEAVVTEASTDHPEMTVLEELESGFEMAGRVIRPARVKVSKKP